MAPTTVIPERAFIPDISGVWSKLGIFLITKYPTTEDTMNTSTNNIGLIYNNNKVKGGILADIGP